MLDNRANMGLVPAMISIAASMGMAAIAEGVETEAQLEQLKSLKCEFAQGYLFSKPIPQNLVMDFIASKNQW
jgi:EAL domain-containing protein (putative c-di-GMP-specific phosphodiesterase class I)